jgi:hypothetical protein
MIRMAAVQILPEKRQRRGGHFTVSSAVCGRRWRRSMVAKVWVLSSEPTCSLRACVIRRKLRHSSKVRRYTPRFDHVYCTYVHTTFLSAIPVDQHTVKWSSLDTPHTSLGAVDIPVVTGGRPSRCHCHHSDQEPSSRHSYTAIPATDTSTSPSEGVRQTHTPPRGLRRRSRRRDSSIVGGRRSSAIAHDGSDGVGSFVS